MPFGLSTLAIKAIAIGLLVLAILGVIAGFAAHERSAQKDIDAADAAKAQEVEHQKTLALNARNDQLAAQLAEVQATRKVTYATITKTVDHFVDRPVYRTACIDASGLSSINAALAGKANDPSIAASAVSAASAP